MAPITPLALPRPIGRMIAAVLSALALAACAPGAPDMASRASVLPLPPMRSFGAPRVTPPERSNAEMAQDFIDLSFRLEGGRELPVLSRFEGPVTLRLSGPVPETAAGDLDRLLARLRREAGIDIRRASAGQPAAITIEFLPRQVMQARVPRAACFVAPRVSSWAEYRRASRATLDWTTLVRREKAAIFIPNDTSPQEVRDCLHEELAQALGPLNDLYRLPDSVFNDDNIHIVLTGFDMLMLRSYHSPRLAAGMPSGAVAARLPQILAALNPAGQRPASLAAPSPSAYAHAIETALGPGTAPGRRRAAASDALAIALANGWNDTRTGFAWMALGRLTQSGDPQTALTAFRRASAIYRSRPGMALQAAHAELQLAAFALSQGDAAAALALAERSLPVVVADENAALAASFLMIRAEALDLLGRSTEADRVRLDSLGWARYGFGSEAEVADRLNGIAALSPLARAAGFAPSESGADIDG